MQVYIARAPKDATESVLDKMGSTVKLIVSFFPQRTDLIRLCTDQMTEASIESLCNSCETLWLAEVSESYALLYLRHAYVQSRYAQLCFMSEQSE